MTTHAMPKGWKNPMRTPLYRVVVEARGEKEPIAVTPGLLKDAAEEFAAAIRAMIARGLERNWTNPTVVLCHI
jgi:hypothetical protein